MARPSIADLFPDAGIVLELEPEDLGAAVLEMWDSHCERNDMATIDHFIRRIYEESVPNPRYPVQIRDEFVLVLAEAWTRLESMGLIFRDPNQSAHWYRRTRRGRKLQTRTDVEAYQRAHLLPRQLLDPTIEHKAWPEFQRGEYEAAVLLAFQAVEVAVRESCQDPNDVYGIPLMRKAFDPSNGPLTDDSESKGEREAIANLFAGAIGHAKNPHSHRKKPIRLDEAARLLLFASHLLEIVEIRRLLM